MENLQLLRDTIQWCVENDQDRLRWFLKTRNPKLRGKKQIAVATEVLEYIKEIPDCIEATHNIVKGTAYEPLVSKLLKKGITVFERDEEAIPDKLFSMLGIAVLLDDAYFVMRMSEYIRQGLSVGDTMKDYTELNAMIYPFLGAEVSKTIEDEIKAAIDKAAQEFKEEQTPEVAFDPSFLIGTWSSLAFEGFLDIAGRDMMHLKPKMIYFTVRHPDINDETNGALIEMGKWECDGKHLWLSHSGTTHTYDFELEDTYIDMKLRKEGEEDWREWGKMD